MAAYVLPTKQFKADADILTTADDGWRNPSTITIAVFHTTEDGDNRSPDDVARWQGNPANRSSYNVIFGTSGRVVRVNDDDFIPWAAGWTANRRGVHGSAIGRASRTRGQWLAHPKQIEAMALWAADVSKRYGIPLVWLSPEQLRAGKKGFCGHVTVSAAWREVNHTDPGKGFPHDVILKRAAEILAGSQQSVKPPNAPKPPVQPDTSVLLDRTGLILDQLVGSPWGKFPGWSQLGGRTIVDALAEIGHALKIPGFRPKQDK